MMKKLLKWIKRQKLTTLEPEIYVSKTNFGKYGITPVQGGNHLTYQTGGGHHPGGWTKKGTFVSLGVHSSVKEAWEVAQIHYEQLEN